MFQDILIIQQAQAIGNKVLLIIMGIPVLLSLLMAQADVE